MALARSRRQGSVRAVMVARPPNLGGESAMDFSRVGQGHRIAAGAAALLFIDLFLSWYSAYIPDQLLKQAKAAGVDVSDVGTKADAWLAFGFIDILLLILVVVA